ncbi:hypothetical protein AX774_g1395 [Zancudomyces culisetae]|uniref:Uncharacterized protein n=1 Tax=Zancudomyces culisetae TaxID=1213189 RepID=A0A1R1PVV8_ZANCU|nr:hypothetical protein AX774_g1395 [Zancudomyces culisetae]|eukprot:OMH85069.1 hypothetical protein AX774_g1395 [Zancudomyces culisetae]
MCTRFCGTYPHGSGNLRGYDGNTNTHEDVSLEPFKQCGSVLTKKNLGCPAFSTLRDFFIGYPFLPPET